MYKTSFIIDKYYIYFDNECLDFNIEIAQIYFLQIIKRRKDLFIIAILYQ